MSNTHAHVSPCGHDSTEAGGRPTGLGLSDPQTGFPPGARHHTVRLLVLDSRISLKRRKLLREGEGGVVWRRCLQGWGEKVEEFPCRGVLYLKSILVISSICTDVQSYTDAGAHSFMLIYATYYGLWPWADSLQILSLRQILLVLRELFPLDSINIYVEVAELFRITVWLSGNQILSTKFTWSHQNVRFT